MINPNHVRLRIRLFGPLDVLVDDLPLDGLYRRKAGLLLAALVKRGGRSVPRTALAELLWPDQALLEGDLPRALESLRQSVAHLRKVLGAEAWRLKATSPRTLLFDLAAANVDLLDFERLAVSDDPAALRQAINLYRGPFLEGFVEPWVLEERERLKRLFSHGLVTLAERESVGGDDFAAVDLLKRAVGADPAKEHTQRKLMELLGRTGQFTAVSEVFGTLRDFLHREHNASPAPETTALFRRIQAEARAKATAAGDATSAKSVDREHPSSQWPIRGVPRPLSSLVGRDLDLLALERRLQPGRVLTITGAGGVGKTRLAISVAERAAPALRDGAACVDLAPLGKAELIPVQVARVLEVREEPGKSLIDAVVERIRDGELLLILDNCEHLAAECAGLAQRLLANCPRLHLLATSRLPLELQGEIVWRAPSLASPSSITGRAGLRPKSELADTQKELAGTQQHGHSPSISSFPAVQLFLERARSAVSDYEPDTEELHAVGHICAMLDGIPLAIELAASRIRLLSASQIQDRLAVSLHLLSSNSSTAMLHHQTMRAAMDWSYQLLTGQECRLLLRLSVFAGSASMESIETICADESLAPSDILDVLSRLVDHSLVVVERTGATAPRYRLLETVRQYSRERRESGEPDDGIQRRYVDWFLNVAEQAEPHLTGPASAEWLDLLEREHSNLMAAFDLTIQRQDGQSATGLAYSLWRYWEIRGHYSDGRSRLAAVLNMPEGCLSTAMRARLLNTAGNLSRAAGDFGAARRGLEMSLAGFEATGNRKGMASALNNLGNIARDQGDMPTARDQYSISLALYREMGDDSGAADLLNNLGNVSWSSGDYSSSAAYYREGLAIYERIGNQLGMGLTLNNLGNIAKAQADYVGARQFYQQSLRLFQILDHGYAVASLLHNIGETDLAEGHAGTARENLEASLSRFEALGSQGGMVESLSTLARVLTLEQRWETAACIFGAVDKLRDALAMPLPESERATHDASVEIVRSALTSAVFDGAWRAGRSMTLAQAVAKARDSGS